MFQSAYLQWQVGWLDKNIDKVRAVPEIILMGGTFFQTLDPQDTHIIRALRPSGHVSALFNPRPAINQIRLDPQDKLSPPLLGHVANKTPPPQDKKVPAAHPPLRIISGTALTRREASLVDYIIASPCIMPHIINFRICHFNSVL